MAIAAYRNLLRSARIAFRGDTRMLSAARLEARKNFENNRGLATESEEYTRSIAHAEEVAKFLRENVVQGQATETEGSYSMFGSACGFADVAIANTVYQS
ncbi:Mitochondrial zinc maintenance protein 1, mitochondrial [Didymosphaeria variabile]|uniref:Mitochondrial zinc maintenance protein 1, mitochondrial n=1 Tax=Didymosphaeria variabile TaxID=1932322 RepID=A0A9W8XHG0_9PLEO|nr:Mitochondrial zinc maintenance protein 1, mitochondrial [Didymosphaeria variabile]KAJ4349754.1 Mitochondrial zinc maintenance protein 1, mitochondrial [Didymosphaeria variabile]